MSNRKEPDELSLLKMEIAFLKVKINTLVMELAQSKSEHVLQNNEKQERAGELAIANDELVFQNKERQKRADELAIANEELVFQNEERQKRTDELAIANEELLFQNEERQKRADELAIANEELVFQNNEKQKRADELVIANTHLDIQYEEKRTMAIKLTNTINEVRVSEEYLRRHIEGLEEMIFMTSHKVRQPITQILGISNLIDEMTLYTEEELKMIIDFIRPCALALDDFTKELSIVMNDLQNSKQNWS